jgi:RNA polymerase sigma-70 factor, ECF subfamily
MARSLAGPAEADDLVQEALFQTWRSWDTVSAYERPGAWARLVLLNLARSHHKRRIRRTHVPMTIDVEALPGVSSDEVLDLWRALGSLEPNQRYALHRHYAEGVGIAEIAGELGANENTVRSWLMRGRARLAVELGMADGEPGPGR